MKALYWTCSLPKPTLATARSSWVVPVGISHIHHQKNLQGTTPMENQIQVILFHWPNPSMIQNLPLQIGDQYSVSAFWSILVRFIIITPFWKTHRKWSNWSQFSEIPRQIWKRSSCCEKPTSPLSPPHLPSSMSPILRQPQPPTLPSDGRIWEQRDGPRAESRGTPYPRPHREVSRKKSDA